MANTILNGLSAAVYNTLVLFSQTAEAAQRLRGRRPRQTVTWR
jgi:hypothetical protein